MPHKKQILVSQHFSYGINKNINGVSFQLTKKKEAISSYSFVLILDRVVASAEGREKTRARARCAPLDVSAFSILLLLSSSCFISNYSTVSHSYLH